MAIAVTPSRLLQYIKNPIIAFSSGSVTLKVLLLIVQKISECPLFVITSNQLIEFHHLSKIVHL